jgi:dTDP-4-amino-4,6-dideoxygalactose transaminase
VTIPLVDLAAAYRELAAEIDAAVTRVTASGWYIGGPEVAAFEEAYAEYCGADHCVGVGNGLDALHLALRAMDVGPGDEVILASNSYIATLLAVSMIGATPVLVEPDSATHNLDPALIEAAITGRTRVLLPTHLYGQPADLEPMLELARKHGLKLLEDAAQAHGASYRDQRIGPHGDVVAWSFYPTKNLGAMGDAGAVTTNDPEIARRVRLMGNYGSTKRYVADVKGVNSRLDPLQAAILAVKLRHLDEWNGRRRAIAAVYADAMADGSVTLPTVPEWADPVWHLYVIQSPERDRVAASLAEAGIQTLVHYPIPPHLQQAYSDLALPKGAYPIAERLADTVLSLPIGPHLSAEQAEEVAAAVRNAT